MLYIPSAHQAQLRHKDAQILRHVASSLRVRPPVDSTVGPRSWKATGYEKEMHNPTVNQQLTFRQPRAPLRPLVKLHTKRSHIPGVSSNWCQARHRGLRLDNAREGSNAQLPANWALLQILAQSPNFLPRATFSQELHCTGCSPMLRFFASPVRPALYPQAHVCVVRPSGGRI